MANTLPNGTVVPEGTDSISGSGVAEMRALGSSVDSVLADKAALSHTHSQSDITGLASSLAGKANVEAVELSPGTDANTLTTPGIYYESNSSQVGPNFPGSIAGVFTVTASPTRLHVQQQFISFGSSTPRQWYRSRYEGSWSSWKQLVTESDPRLSDARPPTAHEHAWADIAGKPSVFPSTIALIEGLQAALARIPQDTDWRVITPTGYAVDPTNTGTIELRRRGTQVMCRFDGLLVTAGSVDTFLLGNGLPPGFTVGEFGQVVDVVGGYTSQAGMNGATRHRLVVYGNDIRYIGQIHGATTTEVTPARADQTRRIYGWLPAWETDDAWPTNLPGSAKNA